MTRRNPIARDLHTPKYRPRQVPDKRRELDEKAAEKEAAEELEGANTSPNDAGEGTDGQRA